MALTLLTPLSDIYRQDLEVDSVNLVDPTHLDCLVAGEWVILSSGKASATSRLKSSPIAYQVFTEKGDYSAQALSKVTVLNDYSYIAETDQVSGTPAEGTLLCIDSNGLLAAATAAQTPDEIVVAISLGMSGSTLKFQRVSPYALQ